MVCRQPHDTADNYAGAWALLRPCHYIVNIYFGCNKQLQSSMVEMNKLRGNVSRIFLNKLLLLLYYILKFYILQICSLCSKKYPETKDCWDFLFLKAFSNWIIHILIAIWQLQFLSKTCYLLCSLLGSRQSFINCT